MSKALDNNKESGASMVETPLMKQYVAIKAKYPDALLLFRVGDFYETFGEDAIKTSNILGIVLTRRANGKAAFVELAGFPHHALDTYLPKLVRAGQKVAICDQLEDPKLTKTIVKRGVTELVTPGVSYNDKILDHKTNNFLAAVHFDGKTFGLAFLDVSTGEYLLSQGNRDYAEKLLQSFRPSEVILQKSKRQSFVEYFGSGFFCSYFDDWVFTLEFANDILLKHFQTKSLKGFGVEKLDMGIIAAGACLHYLSETHHDKLDHISRISRIDHEQYVWLDRFSIRNLELLDSANENATSLMDVLDQTISPMGSRLLRRWLMLPLKDRQQITDRHDVVAYLISEKDKSTAITTLLRSIGDLERLISKVATLRVNPREVLQIKRALDAVIPIRDICVESNCHSLKVIGDQLNPCTLINERISSWIQDDPPVQLSKGGVITENVSKELDELRKIAFSGKDYLVQLQQREIENTGISSLKVGYNNVFGYFLEVTNTHKDKVPERWMRKQTLVNSERYITEELKEYEEKILGAEDKILQLESTLFEELIAAIAEYTQPIQLNAALLARIDCLLSFAQVSLDNNYCRPVINEGIKLKIEQGRHPVIEKHLPPGETYIANDVYLDNSTQQIIIITGPNMSGKSAVLRQTALIVIMAQIGCFVPATLAEIGLVDKVFTRVGATDNITSGESTFMVEMNETASILNNISDRSLILLDEIGRGTSTYDGISIAWAIAEYLHNHPVFRPKVLFATHYHELNEMAQLMPRVKNYHVSVKEIGKRVVFLRKLLPGGSEHSFGIHVAQMAGIPGSIVSRANEILAQLEENHDKEKIGANPGISRPGNQSGFQLSFIQLDDPTLLQIKNELKNIDINTLTPVEALMKLNEIKKFLGK